MLRFFNRLPLALLIVCAAASFSAASRAEPAKHDTLRPSLALPSVASQPAGQYYILLLKWSRDLTIGPVKARVTYLDPPLYLAWLRLSAPGTMQADFAQKLSGFPNVLRVRVAYQAAERRDIHAKAWRLILHGPAGAAIAAREGHRIAPMDLKTGSSGDVWEDDWDYSFAVPAGFLAAARAGLSVTLDGPAGTGKGAWTFGAVAGGPGHADGYVVYLGATLSALCVVLLIALFVTRPPKAGIT